MQVMCQQAGSVSTSWRWAEVELRTSVIMLSLSVYSAATGSLLQVWLKGCDCEHAMCIQHDFVSRHDHTICANLVILSVALLTIRRSRETHSKQDITHFALNTVCALRLLRNSTILCWAPSYWGAVGNQLMMKLNFFENFSSWCKNKAIHSE